MTREEIIEGLKLLEDNMVYFDELLNDKGEYIDVHELLFEAIKALEQEPKETWSIKDVATTFERHGLMTEQEPCEDCISRAEAINAISHAELSFQVESDLNFENYKREVQEIADGILKGQVKAISNLPSVQPKPKTDVLDKIRAEIENDWQLKKYPSSPFACGLRRAIEIIDKYKAESEETE